MGKPTGFMEFTRELPKKEDPTSRIKKYKEFVPEWTQSQANEQSARCMDCGIPFCHNGCPLGNIIPEFNDAVYDQNWKLAYEILTSTNNFPEFTGRICPAPCESACVLGINQPPVAIEQIEKTIIEHAFANNLVHPHIPSERTGKKVAVIGSGPAGLAAAAQLNYAGHLVTVFERDDEIGGLLRYGIPDFKLEKWVVKRRVDVLEQEGVVFKTNSYVGVNIKVSDLLYEFDSIVLSGGSTMPRDVQIKGRDAKGVHFAMEFLPQQNKRVAEKEIIKQEILATGKNVFVIGGGDTGSDCVGTSIRHGAKSVTQIELLTKPPEGINEITPWPNWPMILRTSTSQEEGCDRKWAINTKEFVADENGNLKGIKIVEVDWQIENGKPLMKEKIGSEKVIDCELALIAAGFLHPQHEGMLLDFGVDFDERGNVKSTNYQTNNPKVFAAGDMRRGQSLVVWAISEGRECARKIDEYLMGASNLESKDMGILSTIAY